MITTLIVLLGLLLSAALFFGRSTPVVVVEQRHNGGCLITMLVTGVGIGLFLYPDPLLPSVDRQTEDDEALYENVPPRRQPVPPDPEPDRVSAPDTLINTRPGLRRPVTREVNTDLSDLRMIILVKPFDNPDDAALLQRHFSQWHMEVIQTDDPDLPFWNCVWIDSKSDGNARIREWNRHRGDFDHLHLELKIMQLRMPDTAGR